MEFKSIKSLLFGGTAGAAKPPAQPAGRLGHRGVEAPPDARPRSSALAHPSSPAAAKTDGVARAALPLKTERRLMNSAELVHNFGPPAPGDSLHSSHYRQLLIAADDYQNAFTLVSRRGAAGLITLLADAHEHYQQAVDRYLAEVPREGGTLHASFEADLLPPLRAEADHIAAVRRLTQARTTPGSIATTQLLGLHRSGVDTKTLQDALSSHQKAMDVDAGAQAALDRARLKLEPDPRYTDKTLVVGSISMLGRGNVSTVFKADFRADGKTSTLVFKPETPGADLGYAHLQCGIDPAAPNLAGRAVAAFRIDDALGLRNIPPTHAAVLQGRAGSVMALARGDAVSGTGRMQLRLPESMFTAIARQPGVLTRWALDQGFTAVRLDDEGVLHLANRQPGRSPDPDGKAAPALLDASWYRQLGTGDPQLRLRLVQLQWSDALCGQLDRTPENLLLELDAQGRCTGVAGIDNDACMGAATTANDTKLLQKRGISGAPLPDVIDRALYTRLRELAAQEREAAKQAQEAPAEGSAQAADRRAGPGPLARALGPLVAPAELARALDRLQAIDAHLATFASGQIIESEEAWASTRVDQLLGMPDPSKLQADIAKIPDKQRARHLQALETGGKAAGYVARLAIQQFVLGKEREALAGTPQAAGLPAYADIDRLRALLGIGKDGKGE